jgi:hypothetical protein
MIETEEAEDDKKRVEREVYFADFGHFLGVHWGCRSFRPFSLFADFGVSYKV